jgi:hypothetical protein
MESDAAERRMRRAADAAFLQLLRSCTPSDLSTPNDPSSPVTAVSRAASPLFLSPGIAYETVEEVLRDEPAWGGVEQPERRRELFGAYSAALRQVADARVAAAEGELTALLRRLGVGPDSNWSDMAPLMAAHPAAELVAPARREELFESYVKEVSWAEFCWSFVVCCV